MMRRKADIVADLKGLEKRLSPDMPEKQKMWWQGFRFALAEVVGVTSLSEMRRQFPLPWASDSGEEG